MLLSVQQFKLWTSKSSYDWLTTKSAEIKCENPPEITSNAIDHAIQTESLLWSLKIYSFLFRWVPTYIHIFINYFLLHLGSKHFTLPYSVETYKSFMFGTSRIKKWLFCIKTSLFYAAQSSFILNKKQSICMSWRINWDEAWKLYTLYYDQVQWSRQEK